MTFVQYPKLTELRGHICSLSVYRYLIEENLNESNLSYRLIFFLHLCSKSSSTSCVLNTSVYLKKWKIRLSQGKAFVLFCHILFEWYFTIF